MTISLQQPSGSSIVDARQWVGTSSSTGDKLAELQAAVDATAAKGPGAVLMLPSWRLVVSGPVVIPSLVTIRGHGWGVSGWKLGDGSNTNTLETSDFASLYGTSSSGGPVGFALENLSIDGNVSGNPTGGGVRIFGRAYRIHDVEICRHGDNGTADREAVILDWGSPGGEGPMNAAVPGFEPDVYDFRVHSNRGGGLKIRGATDGTISNCFLYLNGPFDPDGTPSRSLATTTINLNADVGADGWRFIQVHSWGANVDTGIRSNATLQRFLGCTSEGARTRQLLVLKNNMTWESGDQFRNYSESYNAGAVGAEIGDGSNAPVGTAVRGNFISCTAGSLKFVNDGGGGVYDITGFQESGVVYTGSPSLTNENRIDFHMASSAATRGGMAGGGLLIRDTVAGRVRHNRVPLPDPGGTESWYKLGTWRGGAGVGGQRLAIQGFGNSGYSASANEMGRTTILLMMGTGGTAPNVGGTFWHEGNTSSAQPLIQQVKAQVNAEAAGNGTAQIWDVYAYISPFSGDGFFTVDLGNDTHPDTWVWDSGLFLATPTKASDPGVASNTVAALSHRYDLRAADIAVGVSGQRIGFRGSTPVTKPAVSGSRAGGAALASLLTALANQGLITDSSVA